MRMQCFAVLLAATAFWLKAAAYDTVQTTNSTAPGDRVYKDLVRVHWLGKRQMAADTNSAYLLDIWNLPQSHRLLNQTFDKLAAAPWGGRPATNNTASFPVGKSNLLRPLLDDLLNCETFLHVRKASNSAPQALLAVQLPPERVESWCTNVAAILEDLTGRQVAPADQGDVDWVLSGRRSPLVEFSKNNKWMFLRLRGYPEDAARELVVAAGMQATVAAPDSPTNKWLDVSLDLPLLARTLKLADHYADDLPRVTGGAFGDGQYVRTRLTLDFPETLPLELTPWLIPTNLIRDPLISFTAARGFAPLLSEVAWFRSLELTPVPNQLYWWAINFTPVHTFAAVPMANATEFFDEHGQQLEARINAWLTNNAMTTAQYSETNHGIAWMAMGMLTPAIQAIPASVGEVILGRLAPTLPPSGKPAPAELLAFVTGTTNLVMYDWEITELRLKHWIYLTQSARMAFKRQQMPPGAAAIDFITAVAPKLGNTITETKLADLSTLEITRKSHSGFTAIELHLLADWLESPKFPRGTFTLLAAPAQVLRWSAASRSFAPSTNTAPVPKGQ